MVSVRTFSAKCDHYLFYVYKSPDQTWEHVLNGQPSWSLEMVTLIFHKGLCGYILDTILTLLPTRVPNNRKNTVTHHVKFHWHHIFLFIFGVFGIHGNSKRFGSLKCGAEHHPGGRVRGWAGVNYSSHLRHMLKKSSRAIGLEKNKKMIFKEEARYEKSQASTFLH